MDAPDHDIVVGSLGVAVTILFGLLGFASKALRETKADLNKRIDEMREEYGQALEKRTAESRVDRDAIWTQLRSHQADDERMHREMLDRLSQMSTREDLYRATNDLKSDLQKIFQQNYAREQKLLAG